MTFVWLALFLLGLLGSVRVMIAGVTRPDVSGTGVRLPAPRTAMPMAAVFCLVSGALGYGLSRAWSPGRATGVALLAGAAAAVLARAFVRWSSSIPSSDPEDDPRYRFQGQVAVVTQAIEPERTGRIAFDFEARHFDLRAQSIDGSAIPEGAEVVIERIDDDLATVESWATVEQRL